MNDKITRVFLSRASVVKAGAMLAVQTEPDGNGYIRYKEGFSDQTIADATGQPGATANHIARLRWDLGMKISSSNKKGDDSEDIDLLKLHFNELCAMLVEYGFPEAAKLRIEKAS
jgi:hypothetical protein